MRKNAVEPSAFNGRAGLQTVLQTVLVVLAAWLAIGCTLAAAQTYYEPARGGNERKAIMNAARAPVSAEIGSTVIFVVDVLRTDGNAAYLQATPLNPDSSPIDWMRTPFRNDWQAGGMSDVIMVLLNRIGSHWQVVDYIIGPTDVAWYEWVDRYDLPEALFFGG